MAGYPQGSGNPYGAPPANPYGSAPPQPYGAAPPQYYGAAPSQPQGYGAPQPSAPAPSQPQGYGAPQPSAPYSKPEKPGKIHGGGGYDSQPYGYGAPQTSEPYYKPEKPGKTHGGGGYDSQPYGYGAPQTSGPYYKPDKPGKTHGGGGGVGYEQPPPAAGYGAASPFAALVPSQFPSGTDPSLVACFQIADQDGSGLIDDKELQRALSSYNQGFSLRTVHLLMYLFTSSNIRKIGPKEFASLFYSLQNWRTIFERFDRDRSGRIDAPELREALLSLGYAVSPVVLDLLLAKFDKSDGKFKAIEYDNFIECCLTVKGLTDKFKEKDSTYTGSATFTYESFMLTVLPFLIA